MPTMSPVGGLPSSSGLGVVASTSAGAVMAARTALVSATPSVRTFALVFVFVSGTALVMQHSSMSTNVQSHRPTHVPAALWETRRRPPTYVTLNS